MKDMPLIADRTVLIVEDDRAFAMLLATRCQQIGLKPCLAADAASAIELLYDRCIDIIVLDVEMPERAGDVASSFGLILAQKLKQTSARDIPVIILTGRSDPETMWHCKQVGVRYVRKEPHAWRTLQVVLTEMLSLPETPDESVASVPQVEPIAAPERLDKPSPRILCVDDDPDFTLALGMRLKSLGATPIRAFTGAQGFRVACVENPDVVITDLNMPDGEGNYLLGRLKLQPTTQHIPVIVLTGQGNSGVVRELKRVGAEAILLKPIVMTRLLKELNRFVDLPDHCPEVITGRMR
jgi:CheY-like chemotaxis protein